MSGGFVFVPGLALAITLLLMGSPVLAGDRNRQLSAENLAKIPGRALALSLAVLVLAAFRRPAR